MSKKRLVELIGNAPIGVNGITLLDKHEPKAIEELADYLLANGVIVPPCKVGDAVYIDHKTWGRAFLWLHYPNDFIKRKHYIVADVVAIIKTRKQTLVKLGTYNQTTFTREYKRYPISAIGKTVFLTREEAEAKLKEVRE